MIAAMASLSGPAPGMAEIARIAGEAVEGWLREYDGYCGLIVLADEEGERAKLVTLWDTSEDEVRARSGRAAMRDQLAATAGMVVDAFEVYEVPVYEVKAR